MNNENDKRKNNRGKVGNNGGTGRPSKFIEPYKLNLTIEKSDYEKAKLLFGKEINTVFNQVFQKALKKRRVLP